MIYQCQPLASYLSRKSEIDQVIAEVLNSGSYILGENVRSFENEFTEFCGCHDTIGVASGTDAIEITLRVLKVTPTDYIITPSYTATATVSAILRAGAKPLFVDINENNYTIDTAAVHGALEASGKPIKAIIAVHLYGTPADILTLREIANKFNIPLIEDCAQAHGATVNGRKIGSIGDFGCFSFYPTKNLGALGDGGAVTCNNVNYAKLVRSYREYGWEPRFNSIYPGINSRLDEIQAAILRTKLKYITQDNARRQHIANQYSELLKATQLILPYVQDATSHVFHQYVIRTENRDELKRFLLSEKIITAIHYPVPVHCQPAYQNTDWIYKTLPVTNTISESVLSLPIYPELQDTQVMSVASAIMKFYS